MINSLQRIKSALHHVILIVLTSEAPPPRRRVIQGMSAVDMRKLERVESP